MKTAKINLAFLTLAFICIVCALNAQDYVVNNHKWGSHPSDFDPPFSQKKLEAEGFKPQCHISKTKAIYSALQEGDVLSITSKLSEKTTWNGQTDFPYPVGDPHFNIAGLAEVFFNKVGQEWTNWEVQELTYEETSNSIITVKGYYSAVQRGVRMDVPFIHIWTWTEDYITAFQHYETSQAIAERW